MYPTFLRDPFNENPSVPGEFNAMDKKVFELPKGPCGKKIPPGGLPDILVALEY